MKRILLCILIVKSCLIYSQTFSELKAYSEFVNKPLESFEKFIPQKPSVKKEKFGITNLIYDKENYLLSIKENHEDNGLISDVFVLQKKENDYSHKLWYDLLQQFIADPSFIEVKAVIENNNNNNNNNNNGYKSQTMKISEIINLLRTLSSTENVSYGVTFKKDNLFYAIYVLSSQGVACSLSDKIKP